MLAIRSLAVKCSNSGGLCGWMGTLATLPDHMAACKFTLLPCPRECRDVNNSINRFMRKDLAKHVKDYCPNMRIECQYCKMEDMRSNIDSIHANVCPKTPFSCSNAGCSDVIERQGVKRHLADCGHAQIACKYARLGCGAMVKKKDMTVHVQDTLHLQIALESTDRLQTANGSLAKKIEKLVTREKVVFTFKIRHYQQKKDLYIVSILHKSKRLQHGYQVVH